MGEIADMMLDGTLCEGCGVYLGSGNGYATYCKGCSPKANAAPVSVKIMCHICKKKVKEVGLSQHLKDVHNIPLETTE